MHTISVLTFLEAKQQNNTQKINTYYLYGFLGDLNT